jgi:hypothetical protein
VLFFAALVDADAGGFGALEGAGVAAVELAVPHDALARDDAALAALTGAFNGWGI